MDRLKDKAALVFGSGPDVGGTVAHFLAREGARLVVADSNQDKLDKTIAFLVGRGYDALGLPCDLTSEDEVSRTVAKAAEHLGGLDIAVDTHTVLKLASFEELSIDIWGTQVEEMLTPGMLAMKYSLSAMQKAESRGSMVHVLSAGGHWGHPGRPGFSAMKAALLNLARVAAMEMAHLGIRVNTITPVGLEHNIWTYGLKYDDAPRSRYSFNFQDALRTIPLGRFPRASDIAWATVFLASDESSFITGADIPVDGGVRAKYPMWVPGEYTQRTRDEYIETLNIDEFGEPVRPFLAKGS